MRADESSREPVPWLDAVMRVWHYLRGYHGDDVGFYESHHHDPDEGNYVIQRIRCLSCGALTSEKTSFPDQPWR